MKPNSVKLYYITLLIYMLIILNPQSMIQSIQSIYCIWIIIPSEILFTEVQIENVKRSNATNKNCFSKLCG